MEPSALKDTVLQVLYETADVSAALNQVLPLLGAFFRADLVYMVGADGNDNRTPYVWTAADFTFPEGGGLSLAHLADAPGECSPDGLYVRLSACEAPQPRATPWGRLGVRSVLACSLRDNGRHVGWLGVADRSRRDDWKTDEEQRGVLIHIARLAGLVLFRARRAERERRRPLPAPMFMDTEENVFKAADILDSIGVGVVALKMPSYDKLEPLYANAGQYAMLRIDQTAENATAWDVRKAELESRYFADAFAGVHPDDMERVRREFKAGYETEHFTIKKYRLLRGDGSYVWVNVDMRLRGVTPLYRLFYATYTDVSEEQELQWQLAEALRTEKEISGALEKASRAKTDFLARISHDIRTPMNAIMGLTTLAKNEILHPDVVKTTLDKLEGAGKFLLSLLNDILDIAQIEKDSLQLHLAPYDLQEFREQLEVLIVPQCQKKNIDFVFDLRGLRYSHVLLDKMRFHQIFFNLLNNAVKYTPQNGKIELHIQDLERTGNISHKRFIVRDNGIGMSEEFQKRMFEPFSREERVQTSQGERSTGLGLNIVKLLVNLMGGVITVRSAPDKGTEYTIDMDVHLQPEGAELPASPNAGGPSSLQGVRVLLCEDNALNTEIATYLLEEAGARVESVVNGQLGVEAFAASPVDYYDAVLMDIRMPVMDGNEAARLIRGLERPDAARVPIIAVTANAYAEDRQLSEQAGMNAHLAKPIDPPALYAAIRTQIAARPPSARQISEPPRVMG